MLNCFEFNNNPVSFLELFAGSGIMGLEAISRGYTVKGIEIDYGAIKTIKKNYNSLGLNANVIKADCLKYKTDEKFDVIYIDPPWQYDYLPILKKANELINDNGIIIIEYDKTKNIDINDLIRETKCGFKVIKSKQYGRVLINFLKKM